jgi:hypothetical protein
MVNYLTVALQAGKQGGHEQRGKLTMCRTATTETPLSKLCSNETSEFRRDNFCQLHLTATQVSDFIQLLLEGLIQVTDWTRQGDAITAGGGATGRRFHIGGLDQYSVSIVDGAKLCFFAFFFPSSSPNNEITTN